MIHFSPPDLSPFNMHPHAVSCSSASRGAGTCWRDVGRGDWVAGWQHAMINKSAVGVVGDLDVDDCATGSFCSSCAIPLRVVGGLWSDGVGCDACCYPFGVLPRN